MAGEAAERENGLAFASVPVRSRRKAKVEPLRLSPTAVSAFHQCPQLYKFLYVDKLGDQYSRPKPYFTMGNHVHATLRDLLRLWPPERRTAQAAQKLLEKNWRRYRTGFKDSQDEQRWAEKAREQLKAFVEGHDLSARPVMLEEALEARITPGLVLRGRVDRVDREPDGSLHIVDYKTGKMPAEADWLQLELHALALSLSRRSAPPVRRLSYLYLGPSELVSTALSPGSLEQVQWDLLGTARSIRQERRFRPRRGPWCKGCDFRPICPTQPDVSATNNDIDGQLELWDDLNGW